MPDREKLIKAWEIFRDSNPYQICEGREFRAFKDPEYCMGQMIADTIELLKEQEAKPVLSERECETLPNHYERKGFCPKCHQVVEWYLNRSYCGFCGKELKWND